MSFSLRNARFIYDHEPKKEVPDRIQGILVDELDVSSTGVTAIIGDSGSGKTTLLSLLAGFLKPDFGESGAFTFEGRDVAETGIAPGHVSFVFQSPMLFRARKRIAELPAGAGVASA